MKEYEDKILKYLSEHEYATWRDLYELLGAPNPNTLNFSLHVLRFDRKKIKPVDVWSLRKDHS